MSVFVHLSETISHQAIRLLSNLFQTVEHEKLLNMENDKRKMKLSNNSESLELPSELLRIRMRTLVTTAGWVYTKSKLKLVRQLFPGRSLPYPRGTKLGKFERDWTTTTQVI